MGEPQKRTTTIPKDFKNKLIVHTVTAGYNKKSPEQFEASILRCAQDNKF
jgi:hypothetical protein